MRSILALGVIGAVFALACGSSGSAHPTSSQSSSGGDGGDGGAAPAPVVVAPYTDHAECMLSLDCPAGTHCDLGECVQDCNEEQACDDGSACSARAHCLPPDMPDQISEPVAQHRGDVSASLQSALIDAGSGEFSFDLTSTASGDVKYRVTSSSAHLKPRQERGTFSGTTTLSFDVDRSLLTDADTPATIVVLTSLGEISVSTTTHRDLSGYYQGTLHYDQAPLPLGDSSFGLTLLEDSGAVKVAFDEAASMLFPLSGAGDTGGVKVTGSGTAAPDSVTFDVTQAIAASAAPGRNFFGRAMTRSLKVSVTPGPRGSLAGDFTETVAGIRSEPIVVHGSVEMRLLPARALDDFRVGPTPATPMVSTSYAALGSVFAWGGDCSSIAKTGCAVLPSAQQADCALNPAGHAQGLAAALVSPLLQGVGTGTFTDAADACQAALNVTSEANYQSTPAAQACGRVGPLACLLPVLDAAPSGDRTAQGFAYSATIAHLLDLGELVAGERVVDGLHASFTLGAHAQAARADDALAAMAPPMRWVLQPQVLDSLSRLPKTIAAGDPSDKSVAAYPAAAALANALQLLSTLDASAAQLDGAQALSDASVVATRAQRRALLAHLEAITLSGLLQSWRATPPELTSRFVGLLTGLDRSFSGLAQGAAGLGLQPGFVPFLYRVEDAGKAPTNFEQVYAEASRVVGNATDTIAAFEAAQHQEDQDRDALANGVLQVKSQYDARLQQLCGNDVDFEAIVTNGDWSSCGATSGQIKSGRVAVAAAGEATNVALQVLNGKAAEIRVSVQSMEIVYGLRQEDIGFHSDTGQAINALSFTEGTLHAVENGLMTASNNNLFGGFSAIPMGIAVTVIGLIDAGLQLSKDELALAQSLHTEMTNASVEQVRSMEAIQREIIELEQLRVQVLEQRLREQQVTIDTSNLISEALETVGLRSQAIQTLASSSLLDPSLRLLRNQLALQAEHARAAAQARLALAGRALQYELNMSLPNTDHAALAVMSSQGLKDLSSCLLTMFQNYRLAFGSPQQYVTNVSLREQLGIDGPRTDDVTGQTLSEGQLFRQALLKNQNLDDRGTVTLGFATSLQPGNGQWSDSVCNDRITGLQAQLVGDFLGDNQAQINVQLDGVSLVRACGDGAINTWSLGATSDDAQSGLAIVQAGVNGFGDAPANTSLFGQSVARAQWKISVPSADSAPENADVDLTKLDDIVLRISHAALPLRGAAISVDTSCLAGIQ